VSISDHPGIVNIHPDDLCPDCDGDGWISSAKAVSHRGHPCMTCSGTGDIRYKGKPMGTRLPFRRNERIKVKANRKRYCDAYRRYDEAAKQRAAVEKSKKQRIRRPTKVGGFEAPKSKTKLEPIKKTKFKKFKVKGKK